MPAIRFPLYRLMVWVSVAAVNLAAFRLLFSTRNILYLAGGMLAFFMIQAGFFRALKNRGGDRPYWLGFTFGGSIAALSLVSTAMLPEGIISAVWRPYFVAVQGLLGWSGPWLARIFRNGVGVEIAMVALNVLLIFLPLPIAAFAAGTFCRVLFRRREMRLAAT